MDYIIEQTCLICDIESKSSYAIVKHVREHHLNVICATSGNEKYEKRKSSAIYPSQTQAINNGDVENQNLRILPKIQVKCENENVSFSCLSSHMKNKKDMENIDNAKESTIIQNLNTAMSPNAIDPSISSQSENSSILTRQNDGNEKASVQTNKYVERKKKCPHCSTVILEVKNLLRHIKACVIHSKYIQNVPNGYKCLICLDQVSKKQSSLYAHIKKCKDEKLDKNVNEQDFLSKQRGKLKQGYSNSEKKCGICNENISFYSLENKGRSHMKACRRYFKFFRKNASTFECLLCYEQKKDRLNMYSHISDRHYRGKYYIGNSKSKHDLSRNKALKNEESKASSEVRNMNISSKTEANNEDFISQYQLKSPRDKQMSPRTEYEDLGIFKEESFEDRMIQTKDKNNISFERFLKFPVKNEIENSVAWHENINFEEMKIEDIDQSAQNGNETSHPHFKPTIPIKIKSEFNCDYKEHFHNATQGLENGQLMPIIQDIFSMKEQPEDH